MQILICGSMAFDTIMVFPDRFKNHILPEKIHMLNVAFLVPEMRREFGGTAGNIAYNLKLLEDYPLIMATVGEDFVAYNDWLNTNNISSTHIKKIANNFTRDERYLFKISGVITPCSLVGAIIKRTPNSSTNCCQGTKLE